MATQCLTVAQVASLLGCSDDHVTEMLRDGRLRGGVKVGARRWAIPETAYEAFLAENVHTPAVAS